MKQLVDEDRVNMVSLKQSVPESITAEICFHFMSHLNIQFLSFGRRSYSVRLIVRHSFNQKRILTFRQAKVYAYDQAKIL